MLMSERDASNPASHTTTVNYDGQNIHVDGLAIDKTMSIRDSDIQPYEYPPEVSVKSSHY